MPPTGRYETQEALRGIVFQYKCSAPFCQSFLFDTRDHALVRDSESLPLTLKSFKTLLVLVENSGHVVERSELVEQVWPNTFVEEANLTQQVFTLRKLLGPDRNGRQYIETVPKVGYRFTATVRKVSDDAHVRVLKDQSQAV